MRFAISLSLLFILNISFIKRSLILARSNNNNQKNIKIDVGLILDEQDWMVGEVSYKCIQMAVSDFYATHLNYKTRLVLHTRGYQGYDVVSAAAAAMYLIEEVEVKAIIGPLRSSENQFVIHLGTKAQVPIISYSATSPFLSSSLPTPYYYFIRATQTDLTQVQAIGSLIQTFGWKEVVPIHGNDQFGQGIMPCLVDILQQSRTRMPYQSFISPLISNDQITQELYKLKTMQTRVFILHLWPEIGIRWFLKAKELGMMSEGYVWILTNGMIDLLGYFDHNVIESMQGVLGVKTFVPRTQKLANFTKNWSLNNNATKQVHPPNVYGLWAYDAVFALAEAAEEVANANNNNLSVSEKTSKNSSDLNDIRVSNIGPKLLEAVKNTSFRGIAGNFSLNEVGELKKPSAYQFINVVGNGWKNVGFWTVENGIMKELNDNPTSKSNLGAIIWPGERLSVPKGWVISGSDKKLRIGVPVKYGFTEFVGVHNNTAQVTGYCIDVFNAVMAELPYYVSYEFVPYTAMKNFVSSSYDDLTYQVYLGNYDAVVGDVTIVGNRSQYVDYTLPFTESGVTMVVPVKKKQSKQAWLFMKPLTWDLWVMTVCFFVFIAFIIWVLEHRVNQEFRGPPLYQAGTTLYHSFSTMVFAHSENVLSNLARFVMVVWIFLILILTQSYTASLASMLTIQKLQPTVQDVRDLIKGGESVAYQQGSFVKQLLKHKGFKESQLKPYNGCHELDELLSKGSKNGGVAAVFDELPYMKLFLGKFCHKYSMVQPTYNTGGFGFVFPKGSPLVPDVSRAISSVTEGEKMVEIEKAWFNKEQDDCEYSSDIVSYDHYSLGLESFWGLFLIAGVAATLALGLFLADFLYKHRHIWIRSNESSIWCKIKEMVKTFDKMDSSSHTVRKNQQQQENGYQLDEAAESMPNTNCPPSPLSISSE